MELENTYSIALMDGTVLSGLTKNGDNYISSDPIDPEIFEDNCSNVVISDGEVSEEHSCMALIHLTRMENGYWFALRDLTDDELEKMKTRADVDYLALMCDVEL